MAKPQIQEAASREPYTVLTNSVRTIAALEKTIAQLTAVRDCLTDADAKSGPSGAGEESGFKEVCTEKAPATKRAAKKTA